MDSMTMSFMAACISFFGLKEGQTKLEFGKEVKMLTPTDRDEIKAGLEKNGYTIVDVTAPKS